jgi:hypothetical protein
MRITFSTDVISSEIGRFDDKGMQAQLQIINDPCLAFNTKNLHNSKYLKASTFDCTWEAYFDDGNNHQEY